MPYPTDHTAAEQSIHKMVYNRIPFLVDGEANNAIISTFILEATMEFETCIVPDGDVGVEGSYNVAQKSFLADVVAISILMTIAADNSNKQAAGGDANTILTKAKAGSVEVEYEQFKGDSGSSLIVSANKLKDFFQESAERKGRKFGCSVILDVLEDFISVPFKVYNK